MQVKRHMDELDMLVEACTNESTAAAMLAASLMCPVRGSATWKSVVGANVASNALSNLTSPGVMEGAWRHAGKGELDLRSAEPTTWRAGPHWRGGPGGRCYWLARSAFGYFDRSGRYTQYSAPACDRCHPIIWAARPKKDVSLNTGA